MMKWVKTKPVDNTDLGFKFPGYKIRWISSYASENNPGRIWSIIRKSEIDPGLVKYIEGKNPAAFRGGDTIRRGDLVLGYASDEAAMELRASVDEATADLEGRIKGGADVKRQHGTYSKVEVNEDADATQEMIERFKAGKEN